MFYRRGGKGECDTYRWNVGSVFYGEQGDNGSDEEDVNKLAWRTGQLRFMETPLDKVIEDLSDYYQVKIANQTKNEGARLTATFNNLPLEDVLQVVNQTLDARLVSTSKK